MILVYEVSHDLSLRSVAIILCEITEKNIELDCIKISIRAAQNAISKNNVRQASIPLHPTSTPVGKQKEMRSLYFSGSCFSGG